MREIDIHIFVDLSAYNPTYLVCVCLLLSAYKDVIQLHYFTCYSKSLQIYEKHKSKGDFNHVN